jgi:hypothetical protein
MKKSITTFNGCSFFTVDIREEKKRRSTQRMFGDLRAIRVLFGRIVDRTRANDACVSSILLGIAITSLAGAPIYA